MLVANFSRITLIIHYIAHWVLEVQGVPTPPRVVVVVDIVMMLLWL
jgi:hypothetical protein